ncbi:MAG: pilus assembly protein CpaE [Microbacteriaceae bacterium]|nr:pilus assembly protein CpaE [Microbacteriaceae bacterium]
MISTDLARELALAGLRWRPASGDAFSIEGDGFEGDVFIVSEMTVEAHEYDTGTILGFNGTTEWALDSVALEQSLWLPHEHQLRELLGGTFVALRAGYTVEVTLGGRAVEFTDTDAAEAYGKALLALIRSAA